MGDTVLLVASDPATLQKNKAALAAAGYRVLVAGALDEARHLLESEAPALLALDVALLEEAKGLFPSPQTITVGEISLDFTAHKVLRGGKDLRPSQKEFALLSRLWQNRGSFVPTDTLHMAVWGEDVKTGDGAVRERVSRLRRKLGPNAPLRIEGVRKKGYRLVVERKPNVTKT